MLRPILRPIPWGILLLGCSWAFAANVEPYRQAAPGFRYTFPRDHFEHPDFRTEWWYYTGNLRDSAGRRFGFELVFFRHGQRPGGIENRSAWRIDDLYMAHLALTDIDNKKFYKSQRLNRAGPGVAGARFAERRVWNGNWSARWEGARQVLEAIVDEFHFRLELDPIKPPVIHGIGGISQKSAGVGKASHYVSLPRLLVSGEVTIGGRKHTVTGSAWMDHEWFTSQLADDQIGWDWFSVQLDNGTELMLFQLRRKDGSLDPYSAGTYIDPQGRPRHLSHDEFSLSPLRRWKKYPVEWQIRVPSLSLLLEAKAALDDQELDDNRGPMYWEGSVTYSGSATGVGYLEMTGYDKPVRLE
jgi:predicted secreted hydrolase